MDLQASNPQTTQEDPASNQPETTDSQTESEAGHDAGEQDGKQAYQKQVDAGLKPSTEPPSDAYANDGTNGQDYTEGYDASFRNAYEQAASDSSTNPPDSEQPINQDTSNTRPSDGGDQGPDSKKVCRRDSCDATSGGRTYDPAGTTGAGTNPDTTEAGAAADPSSHYVV